MLERYLTLVVLLTSLGCQSGGLERHAEFATNKPAAPIAETEPSGAPGPLEAAGSHQTAIARSGFELWTDPGELPYFQVGAGEEAARLPLEHTHVSATLHGLVAEVEVTQTYHNTHPKPIEAVYVFPLPENSAVNFMQMVIGKRKVVAKIDERARARRTYEAAKSQGLTAALLEQERPNVFTHSVANIAPGEKVDVVVRYIQDLSYDRGEYEFVFPMVVGPRFNPGTPASGATGTGTAPDTDRVVDASRISPPYVAKGERSGHDISLTLRANTGHPITSYQAVTHQVVARQPADGTLELTLSEEASRPNRDFVLRYSAPAEKPQATLYTSRLEDKGEGYFSLVIEPPALDLETLVGRREIIFVVDVSGSMAGTPLAMCRLAMRAALERLRPQDTFNVITFAGHTTQAFAEPRPANRRNIAEALRIVGELNAGGGTMMASAVDAALSSAVATGRQRYVFFMTDGYIGNEAEIIEKSRRFVDAHEKRGVRAKVFGFGVGASPNRHLVGGLSRAGKGISVYASTREDPNRAVSQFYHYIDRAVLTDVSIDWGGAVTRQVYPSEIPDLFASHPIVLHGRLEGAPERAIRVLGKVGERSVVVPVTIEPAVTRGEPSVALGTLWARAKVDSLEEALLDGSLPDAAARITELGLDFNLVTRFTSFVAVDTERKIGSADPRLVAQAVEQPEGVDISSQGHERQPVSAGATPAPPEEAAKPTSKAGEGYGYSFEDGIKNERGMLDFDEEAAPVEQTAPMAASNDAEAYEVASKRGCGCRMVGVPTSDGLMAALGMFGVWLAYRRRRTGAPS